jgi:hypothetical protein
MMTYSQRLALLSVLLSLFVSLNESIRVALIQDSCGTDVSGPQQLPNQLIDSTTYSFTVAYVPLSSLTYENLVANYDVVYMGSDGQGANKIPDVVCLFFFFSFFSFSFFLRSLLLSLFRYALSHPKQKLKNLDALYDFVNNGGGFVSSGWLVFDITNPTIATKMNRLVPIPLTPYQFGTPTSVTITDTSHPITNTLPPSASLSPIYCEGSQQPSLSWGHSLATVNPGTTSPPFFFLGWTDKRAFFFFSYFRTTLSRPSADVGNCRKWTSCQNRVDSLWSFLHKFC